MNVLRKDKKDEEEGYGLAYLQLEKSAVIQEARIFHESPLKPKKCLKILTKLLVILSRGERLSKLEATDTFFAMTKLFQSNDINLRRMVYLVIKELSVIADDVIIVTSSLTKDMTGPEMAFRGPAIRALCKITDATMVQSIERYLKQAIVDKCPTISSSVLASSIHLMSTTPEIVRRWANEIQEAANSSKVMVQYHALGLLYLVRNLDRLAVTKLIQKFTRCTIRSPYAHCIMIRIVAKQLEDEGIANNAGLFEFLEQSLRLKAEMVIYESARAIVGLREVTAKELAPAVSVLQLFCSSHKSVMRYAAVRTLSAVAMRHPTAVTACNMDLEQLIADPNRSIATLAITTLLKTGSENSVERLLKHICSFMTEITDEFKLVVLASIRALATKYPRKYAVLLNFLSGLLRDTAGYSFKRAVVLVIESIIKDIPDAKSLGLLQLCDFIEDCEHVRLTQRILYLIGREGPYLKRPRQFTRYIYNRVVLESAPVKCTATTALARFGAHNEEMRPSILVLLQRIMLDEDDEVRDRAAFYYHLLSTASTVSADSKALRQGYLLTEEMQISPSGLERALLAYTRNLQAAAEGPFLLSSVPLAAATPAVSATQASIAAMADASYMVTDTSIVSDKGKLSGKDNKDGKGRGGGRNEGTRGRQERYAEEMSAIPQLAKLGGLFKSSKLEELTEPETEYQVICVKHIFKQHLVLQFDCVNTMPDQVLTDVTVFTESEDGEFKILDVIQCASLTYNKPGTVYMVIALPEDLSLHSTAFSNDLKFSIRDIEADESDAGMPDEYPLKEVSLNLADSMQRIAKGNFTAAWEDMDSETEVEETYAFTKYKTIKDTMEQLIEHLGMQPCDRTDQMSQEAKSSHLLLLSGVFRDGSEVLARCKFARVVGSNAESAVGGSITLQILVRSTNPEVSRTIADSIV